MVTTIALVPGYGELLRAEISASAALRVRKQLPSVQVMTAGFTTDHNSTGVSATGHRYRE